MKLNPDITRSAKNIFVTILALVAICAANISMAAIHFQVGGAPVTNVSNFEDFENYSGSPGEPLLTPSGFTFDCANCTFNANQYGTDGQSLYQNGGSASMTSISLTSGADIAAISMVNGNGWGPQDPDTIWVRVYNDGSPFASAMYSSIPLASTITVWADDGSVFDEVRIQSYHYGDPIEADESQFGAIAIDNITVGSMGSSVSVPVPAQNQWGLMVLILLVGGIGFLMQRRRA